jgi:hypothetical protein
MPDEVRLFVDGGNSECPFIVHSVCHRWVDLKPSAEGTPTLAVILQVPLKPLLDEAFPEWEQWWNRAPQPSFQLGTTGCATFCSLVENPCLRQPINFPKRSREKCIQQEMGESEICIQRSGSRFIISARRTQRSG